MALPETRFQFRVQLSDTDRHVDAQQTITVLLHPSETLERMYTRLIAWALWYTPDLKAADALNDPFFKDKRNKGLSAIIHWLIENKRRCEQQAYFSVNPKDKEMPEKIIVEKIRKGDYV